MTEKSKKIKDKKTMFIYSTVFLSILLVYIFCAVVIPSILHEHTLVKTEAVEANCWECGSLEYWTCTDCGKVYEDENASIKTLAWKRKTERLEHVFREATCTEAKTCCLCNYTEGSPLGHDFEPPQYMWSENMSECTATRICKRDSAHIDTETAQSVFAYNCYTVDFDNSDFGVVCAMFDKNNGIYENTYEGNLIPTVVGSTGGQTFELEKLGTISYPSNITAQDFDITYIDGIKYRFVGMSNDTIRLYKEDDYKNFIEINHVGHHNYIAVSPHNIESFGGKVLFTGYRAKLEWFACDIKKLTSDPPEYNNYCLSFDQNIIGKDATPCIDFENNILYWYGYTTHYSDTSDTNKIIITAWDISELNLNDPKNEQVKLISQTTTDNFGVTQGRKCYNGDLYIGVANTGKPFESKLLRLDAETGTVKTKLEFDSINEIEGISYTIKGNEITWFISDYFDFFNIKIER